MQSVARHVADGKVLDLIQRFLTAGVMEDGVFKLTTVGTPQGGVISPLLANIALNHLDWQLDKAGYRFVRYADDFVVLCRSHRKAQEARDLLSKAYLKTIWNSSSAPKRRTSRPTGKDTSFSDSSCRHDRAVCGKSPSRNSRIKSGN